MYTKYYIKTVITVSKIKYIVKSYTYKKIKVKNLVINIQKQTKYKLFLQINNFDVNF